MKVLSNNIKKDFVFLFKNKNYNIILQYKLYYNFTHFTDKELIYFLILKLKNRLILKNNINYFFYINDNFCYKNQIISKNLIIDLKYIL